MKNTNYKKNESYRKNQEKRENTKSKVVRVKRETEKIKPFLNIIRSGNKGQIRENKERDRDLDLVGWNTYD